MDRERLFKHLDQRYSSKRDMLSRIPLGEQADALWQELLSRRRAKATILPIHNYMGLPYWYVTTGKMVSASEKIVEAMFENEKEFDPYTEAPTVTTLEEVFYTSYVDGARITIHEAMEYLQSEKPPRDIEEQMISNNRLAGSYAGSNLYRATDETFMKELVCILTDGMDDGGQDYRSEDWMPIPAMGDEEYRLPTAVSIPDRVNELLYLLGNAKIHPLIKASVVQAWLIAVRPFSEGNERLGRLLSTVILLRSGYTFFSDISLSALIARKSYGYYEAIANILREENCGDLTYFLEYYLEILARAVDERRLRIDRMNAEIQRAEAELARTALSMPSGDEVLASTGYTATGSIQQTLFSEDAAAQPENILEETDPLEEDVFREIRLARLKDELYKCVARGNGKLSRCCRILLRYIDMEKFTFTSLDFEKDIPVTTEQAGNLVTHLKAKGIITSMGKTGKYATYTFQPIYKPLTEDDYSPELLNVIKGLYESTSSLKDKRLGCILLACLPKGLVTAGDYKAAGQETRLATDMLLAQQMGLVAKIDSGVYRIERAIKSGHPSLRESQREAITEIYEAFGDGSFSRDMIVATLDYSNPHASSTLHELTLLRILDCRKEDGLLYQFLVNPREHPECFVAAS